MNVIAALEGGWVNLSHCAGGLDVRPGRPSVWELVAYSDSLRRADYAEWVIAVSADKAALVDRMHDLESRESDPYQNLRQAREGLARRRERALANLSASHDAEMRHLTT